MPTGIPSYRQACIVTWCYQILITASEHYSLTTDTQPINVGVPRVQDVLWRHRVPAFDDGAVGGDVAAFTCHVPCSHWCTRSYWGRCKLRHCCWRHTTGTLTVVSVKEEALVCAFVSLWNLSCASRNGRVAVFYAVAVRLVGVYVSAFVRMYGLCTAVRWEERRIWVQNCDCGMWV